MPEDGGKSGNGRNAGPGSAPCGRRSAVPGRDGRSGNDSLRTRKRTRRRGTVPTMEALEVGRLGAKQPIVLFTGIGVGIALLVALKSILGL